VSSPNRALEAHSQFLSLIPGTVGSYLRVAFYRFVLRRCDPTATIAFGVLLSRVDAEIHQHVYVGPRCLLGMVTLEQDVLLGPAVQILSGPNLHGINNLEIPIREQPGEPVRVTVGQDSWIGAGSILLASIAPQTVVGAGSIVTKQFEPRSILVGNPARVLRSRYNH
jgi:virginiamycin A acetyltransferase